MALVIKGGVRVLGVKPEMVLAIYVVEGVYREFLHDCVITSCTDGVHANQSKHYTGDGVDFRTNHIVTSTTKDEIFNEIKQRLTSEYIVLFESEGTPNEHIHVHYKGGSMRT